MDRKDDAMAQPLRKLEKETSSYAKRIRDFVEFDCVEGARRLVAEAIRQGDESEELLRWQRLLGPARSRDSSDELQLDRTPEFDWLRAHRYSYQGQWVALDEGRLLSHSRDLREVESDLETMTPSRRPFLHFVEPTLVTPATPQALRKPNPDTRPYAERIRELVEHDYVGGARKLLAEALEKGELDEDLLKWQQVLAPAVSKISSNEELDSDPMPDVNWIRQHEREYSGQWVALLAGELLASSPSLDDVIFHLEKNPPDRRILLHYID
jgi:hypothetical protein